MHSASLHGLFCRPAAGFLVVVVLLEHKWTLHLHPYSVLSLTIATYVHPHYGTYPDGRRGGNQSQARPGLARWIASLRQDQDEYALWRRGGGQAGGRHGGGTGQGGWLAKGYATRGFLFFDVGIKYSYVWVGIGRIRFTLLSVCFCSIGVCD
jgi:hypothetical protein